MGRDGRNLDLPERGFREEGLFACSVASLVDLVLLYCQTNRDRADNRRLTLRIIVVVANVHSSVAAHLEATVETLEGPLNQLHCIETPKCAVSCNVWHTSLLQGFRRRAVSSARALSMAKRHFEGAKPEVWLSACSVSW